MRPFDVPKTALHHAMDAETVAGLLDVTTRQLNNYINLKGLPSNGSGRSRTFVWSEVREWWFEYRMSLETGDGNDGSDDPDSGDPTSDRGGKKEDIRAANLRKTRAEANLKELQLGRLRGEVISIADVKTRLDRMMGNLRAKLLSLPQKLADRVEGEKTRSGKEGVIRTEIETLCREISTGSIVETDDVDEDSLDISAAAETAPAECVRCGRDNGPELVVGDDCLGWICSTCYEDLGML